VSAAEEVAQTEFDRGTAVTPLGGGRYSATIDPGWGVPRGPNGGYLAAIVMRALQAEVDDAARAPRSLTCHYLRPPATGAVEVEVRVERDGRSMTSLSARLLQDGATCVLALAAFGLDLESALDYATVPMPEVPPAAEIEPWPYVEGMPPISARLDIRPALGGHPFAAGAEAIVGGWLGLAEPRPLDAALLCLYADGWLPAPYARLSAPVPAPTIDLTVHFRARPPAGVGTEPVLVRAASLTSREGYFEEDAHIWAPDGTLLAQSRQLALLRP
jgi:acyl-CoA thioesterase